MHPVCTKGQMCLAAVEMMLWSMQTLFLEVDTVFC